MSKDITCSEQIVSDLVQTLTFVITMDCNLNCAYCYESHSKERMTSKMARKIVDFVMSRDFLADRVIYEFIGGEPFLEIGLIKEVTEHIMRRHAELGHHWKDAYTFSFVTNGTVFTDEVRDWLEIDRHRKSVSVS